jgi:hypothetical protein
MKSRRRITKLFVFVGLVFVFALSLVSQSGAQNKHLKGEYAVAGQATCLTHWLVNPNNPSDPSATTYFVHTASAQGTVTFNGDGTGSGRIYSVDITLPTYTPIPLGSSWSDPERPGILGHTSTNVVEFQFTYTVAPDGAISRTITNLQGEITSGPSAGKFFTQTSFTLTGFVSKDKGTISLSSDPTQAEILTTEIYNDENHNSFYGRQKQECHRTRILTFLGK